MENILKLILKLICSIVISIQIIVIAMVNINYLKNAWEHICDRKRGNIYINKDLRKQ